MKKMNGCLSTVCLGHSYTDEQLKSCSVKLYDEYKKKGCKILGLAANQVNWTIPVFLIKWTDGSTSIIVDPEIVWQFGKRKSNEGCESCGPNRYVVFRPWFVKVRYKEYDTNSASITERTRLLTHKNARRFMHEYDHLCGVTIKDKGELYRWNSIYLDLKKQHT